MSFFFHALRHVTGAVEFPLLFLTSHVRAPCCSPCLCIPYFLSYYVRGVAILGPCTHVTHSAGEPDDGVRLTLLLANWIL
jgi:hypothetical protein